MSYPAAIALLAAVAATPALAAEFSLEPGQKAIGEITRYTVRQGEVLGDIARRFDLGYTELAAVNPGVDPWAPGAGRVLTIPGRHILPEGPRQGIVINLAQARLFYFPPGADRVETYPITIGFIGKNTPLGVSRVVSKEPSPTWYPPASIRREEPELPAAVPPGPDNPLGKYALHLGWKNYLIHGTNKPDSIGRTVSHGCIRLYPEDIERLFGEVGTGLSVRTVEQPATAGWKGDDLYVQVYPSKQQADDIDTEKTPTPEPVHGVDTIVQAAAGSYADLVNWGAVQRAAQQRTGMAVLVAHRGSGPVISRDDSPAGDGFGYDPSQDREAKAYRPYRPGAADGSTYGRGTADGSAYDQAYAPSAYDSRAYDRRSYNSPAYGQAYARPSYDGPSSNPGYLSPPDDPAYDTPAFGGAAAGPQRLYSNWYTGR